jgi:hypothetical protein
LIDVPGTKILAHSPRLNQTRSELNSHYSDRLLAQDEGSGIRNARWRIIHGCLPGRAALRFDIRLEKKRPFDVPSRNIGPPLMPQLVHFNLLKLVVSRFSLISRCAHRAYAAL